MAPELALVYVTGWLPSTAISILHYRSYLKKQNSKKYQTLQRNLNKVGLFWADYAGEIKSLDQASIAEDHLNFKKGLLITSYFLIALSWPGFLFHLILYFSLRVWARPRLEQNLIESDLASKDLTENEIQINIRHAQDSI